MHRTEIRVQWFDTDRENIVFYGNYFRFFQTAEDDFLHAAGISRDDVKGRFNVDFTRVGAECQYKRRVRYGELIQVETQAELNKDYLLTFFFRVFRNEDQELAAEGKVRTVCIDLGSFRISKIPDEVRAKLENAINRANQGRETR